MRTAPEIDVRDVSEAYAARTWILHRVRKLAARHPEITKFRVAVNTPHRRRCKGRRFRVQVNIGVPGFDLIARNAPNAASEALIPALYEAFHRSERQLAAHRASQRHKVRRNRREA